MKIKRLIELIGGYRLLSDSKGLDFEVKGISCNSKEVSDDFIFVAISGNRQDGRKFIGEAINKGARAVIIEPSSYYQVIKSPRDIQIIEVRDARKALARLAAEFYGNPSKKIKIIGVTGTNGKTTVTYLIEAILKEALFNPAVIGTINYRLKDKIIPAKNTTPGSIELQSMLHKMLEEGAHYAVMEVSSHALSQDRVECVNFSSAVFTNLTQDHLDYHKTLEDYFQAKAKLFQNITRDSAAVINEDDAYGRRLKRLTGAEIITYGIENRADVMAKDIKADALRTEFRLVSPKEEARIVSPLIGRHNVYNILAAAGVALGEGLDFKVIKSALEKFSSVPGRLENIDFSGGFKVFVDYAHTDDALKNVIGALRQVSKKKIIVVFGCGGERDKAKRPKMGYVVSELADYAVIANDNPRSENPQDIINDIVGGIKKSNYCIIPDRLEAIRKSLSLAQTGDIVLIAGIKR